MVRNLSGRTRHLTVTAYVEWVLGTSSAVTAPSISTEIDAATGALLARNLSSGPDARVAFVDLRGRQAAWTGDRREFIGRNGTLERPAALVGRTALSGRTGAGLDPCGALQAPLVLAANSSVEIVWLLGEAATALDAQAMIERWRSRRPRREPAGRAPRLGRRARGRCGADAGPVVRRHAERLAALPDPRLPPVGAQRVLPGERRIRLPRPAAGHDGAHRREAGSRARASAACRGPAVRGGRRPALVAAPVGPRGPQPRLR